MKEKRYFCDWALSPFSEKKGRQVSKVLLISFIVITAISILITMHNHGEDLEVYSENAYKYLDEIADSVIGKNGINVAAIPEDVVKYEITYKNGETICTFCKYDSNIIKRF